MHLVAILATVATLVGLGLAGPPIWVWLLASSGLVVAWGLPWWLGLLVLAAAIITGLPPVRRWAFSASIAEAVRRLRLLPSISETERAALEAGTVWIDGELFSGKPDWERILDEPYRELSAEERAFLDGPVEEACAMVDEWETWKRQDLAPEVWAYLKEHRFFALIIPTAYGGLGFTALAHGAVVQKLASRSLPLAVTVMVPNSLGPAELLVHYGTREQKERYLPRLARGDDIPCFALTEPEAGSDASSMAARGVVYRGSDGLPMLRLQWSKRYITLGSVSTLIGLAFKLEDPENLLGKGTEPGITCALVPADTPGVALGRRHDPLGVPFVNCPVDGVDVEVPVTQVIGGLSGVGQGWTMLMETLAAGRGVSLPSMSVGTAKLVARVVGAHATVRRQFGVPLGAFEGIEEPLARIGATTYAMDAAWTFTCSAIDSGNKPAVVSAIAKHAQTEAARAVVKDGMDVLGGAGIVRGPRNLLAGLHVAQPIGITVEGANILTRSLIVFGQGALRCHPVAWREVTALARRDLKAFDDALWRHLALIVRNLLSSVLLSLSRGHLVVRPRSGLVGRYVQKLSWASATFAILADASMLALGGNLKRREKLTGRLADVLAGLYLSVAVLRRFEAEGRRREDEPFVRFAMETLLDRMQAAFDGIFANFPVPLVGSLMRATVGWWSRANPLSRGPSDEVGAAVSARLRVPGEQRDRLTRGVFVPADEEQALGRLERAFELAVQADAVLGTIKAASRAKKLRRAAPEDLLDEAVGAGVIGRDDADLVRRSAAARRDAVQVDSFPADQLARAIPIPGQF
jgi:acyl-CoA dehydrogenase